MKGQVYTPQRGPCPMCGRQARPSAPLFDHETRRTFAVIAAIAAFCLTLGLGGNFWLGCFMAIAGLFGMAFSMPFIEGWFQRRMK